MDALLLVAVYHHTWQFEDLILLFRPEYLDVALLGLLAFEHMDHLILSQHADQVLILIWLVTVLENLQDLGIVDKVLGPLLLEDVVLRHDILMRHQDLGKEEDEAWVEVH